MSGKNLLLLDSLFWLPYRIAVVLRNVLGSNSLDERGQRVLVIKLMGLGSLTQFASLCQDHRVDKSKITLLTFARHREVCQLFGFDSVWFIRTNSLVFFFKDCYFVILQIRKLQPSIIVDYERCSQAVGLYRSILSFAGTCSTVSFESNRSVRGRLQHIYPIDTINQEQLFLQGIEYLRKAETTINQKTIAVDSCKVIININASDYLLARRYPIDSFATIISTLHQWNPRLQFFLTGSCEEFFYVENLARRFSGAPLYNVAGKWTLEKLSLELAQCALFITGDSGPMHLAAHQMTPTVVIWGPTQPKHFGYTHKKHLLHCSLELSCSPCLTHPTSQPTKACRGKIDCMNQLTPSAVTEKAISILSIPVNSHRSSTFLKAASLPPLRSTAQFA
jgi:hypothetical protein